MSLVEIFQGGGKLYLVTFWAEKMTELLKVDEQTH